VFFITDILEKKQQTLVKIVEPFWKGPNCKTWHRPKIS